MTGRPVKEFHQYLTRASNSHVSHNDYLLSPATSFLKYSIEAKSAIDLCARKFPRNNDGTYSKDSLDSLQHLIVAVLPSIMGHFETFQRYLFAGLFDLSVYLKDFKSEDFFNKLSKLSFAIDPIRLSAHRGIGVLSIGSLLSDSLSGWNNALKVNQFFNAYNLGYQLYSNEDCSRLSVLWQLRHSIVHTGGTLTLPDAQKVSDLKQFGNKQIAFDNNFIFEVSRKLHQIIKRSTEGIGTAFQANLIDNISIDEKERIEKFFEVKSSISVWLK